PPPGPARPARRDRAGTRSAARQAGGGRRDVKTRRHEGLRGFSYKRPSLKLHHRYHERVTELPSPTSKHAVIIGAGPAGLTVAYELAKHHVPATVVEADPHYVGGIARTVEHHGYRFDIGGHRFFSKNQEVEDLWTEVLGDEMLTCGRLSRIYYRG